MSELPQNDSNPIDSWEDFGDEDEIIQKLNEAISKVQISASTRDVDPFGKGKSKKETNESNENLDGYLHLAALSKVSNKEDVTNLLKKDFGTNVRLKQIDDTNYLIVFANIIDARSAVRHAQKFLPSIICAIDDPAFQHKEFILENREELRPAKSSVRPATNMSLIRNVVSRHLNVRAPASSKEKEEKEQLQKAREAKKAKDSYWK